MLSRVIAESSRVGDARSRGEIGHRDKTGGFQIRHDIGIDTQRRDRQRQHGGFGLASGDDRLPVMPRQTPGRAGRIGDGGAGAKALRGQSRQQVAGERRLTAEQMRAAGDVEKQAVGWIETDQRCIAVAPVGDAFEQPAVGLEIGFDHRQLRIHGAGVGQAQADLQSEPRGLVGQRGDALRALDRGDDDEAVTLLRRAPLDPVGRETAQPQRQIPAVGRYAHDDPTR